MLNQKKSCTLSCLAIRGLTIATRRSGLVLFLCLLGSLPQIASAKLINIIYIDAGWYNTDGSSNTSSFNHITGLTNRKEHRSFFVFDLSAVTDKVVSASLRVFNPVNGFISPHGNETFALYDVTTSITSLTDGTGGTVAFDDLGKGSLYGSAIINDTSENTVIDFTLNSNALDAINSATGLFALGGTLTSISGTKDQVVFSGTGNESYTRELELTTVPVPTAIWLFGSGLIGLIGVARRKYQV